MYTCTVFKFTESDPIFTQVIFLNNDSISLKFSPYP